MMNGEQVGQSDAAREKGIREGAKMRLCGTRADDIRFLLQLLDESRRETEELWNPKPFDDQHETRAKLACTITQYPVFRLSYAGFGNCGVCTAISWEEACSIIQDMAGLGKEPEQIHLRLREDWAEIVLHHMDKEQAEKEGGE